MTTTTVGAHVTLRRGNSYQSKLVGSEGIPLLGLGTIAKHGGFKGDKLRFYPDPVADRISVRAGDLYVSLKDMTHEAALLGAVARVPEWMPHARLTQDTIALDFRPEATVTPDYLYWVLQTPEYRTYCHASGTGTTNLDLSQSDFLGFRFDAPDLTQQRNRVDVLRALDDKIAANRRAVQAGREFLLAQWSRLVSGADEARVWDTLVETNPKVPTVKHQTAPYLDMKNLPENGLVVEEWGERPPQGGARFENGDTLFARITPCFENGKHGYVDFLGKGEIGYGSTEYIVFRARQGVSPAIPFVVSAVADFRAFAAQHRTGTSGRQRVQARDLVTYEAAWPGDVRAAEFGAFAEPLIARLGAARNENRALTKTRDELLPLLMSGRITVKDAEKTVEEVV